MSKKLKPSALLKHRIILQAAFCVEDLLQSTEHDAKRRPWICIVSEHMESLFEPAKKKPNARARRV